MGNSDDRYLDGERYHYKSNYITKKDLCILGVAFCFLIAGLTFEIYGPYFCRSLYKNQLELSPNSTTHKLWSHTPVPLYLEVYLFNWTNAEEFVEDKKTVPEFEEIGPFVFKEVHDRVNVIWNDNNTVTYNQTRKWNYIPELSEDLTTEITNLNVIGTTLSQILKNYPKLKSVINFLFRMEKFMVTAPAKDWLFEGIDDKLMNFLLVVENIFNIPKSDTKFGWFYGRNMSSSYDGTFTVKTGSDNLFNLGIMDKWNGMNQTNYYKDYCGLVNGSSAELFPPMDTVQDELTVFISDICSSITLQYNESSYVEGIESYKYVGVETTLDNGQFNPDNKCFCRDKCIPYGVRDATTCKKAPLFFSFPHFYLADETYRDAVSGMMPNQSEHEFMIQIDPVTGMPTDVRAQLQINVRLEPIHWLTMFSDVPEMYVPMMWFRQRAKISTELATQALLIQLLPKVVPGLGHGLLAIGILIVLVHMFVMWRRYKKSADSELLIPPTMDQD